MPPSSSMIATLHPTPATPAEVQDDQMLKTSILESSSYVINDDLKVLKLVDDALNNSFQMEKSYDVLRETNSLTSLHSTLLSAASTASMENHAIKDFVTSTAVSHPKVQTQPDSRKSGHKFAVRDWDGTKFFSDYIKEGLEYKRKRTDNVIMLYESPSSSATNTSFHNSGHFKFHDYPAPSDYHVKAILGPCRYALMNGSAFPAFLRGGVAPDGLLEHWARAVPGSVRPTFVPTIGEDSAIYSYLPVEQIENHVNDPYVHYHLVGKDSIARMTERTTKLLPDTRTHRPCVVKTTHSMGGRGIFVIRNDADESEFERFLVEAGNPSYIVTEFVEIERNVACHFFIHPNGKDLIWFGSNENKRRPDGTFGSDSYLDSVDQENLKRLQLPFVEDVVQYCHAHGFWGFCGIDVLFDSSEHGYLVDVNPRVTGSCPGLMTLALMRQHFGFQVGLMRRSGDINFYGSPKDLLEEVNAYNDEHVGHSRIVILSLFQNERTGNKTDTCRINIAVYGNDMDECKVILNRFAKPTEKSTK